MKPLQYLTILLFILASLCMGSISYGQTKKLPHYYMVSYVSSDNHNHISNYGVMYMEYYGMLSEDSLETYAYRNIQRSASKGAIISTYKSGIIIMSIFEFKTKREFDFYRSGK